MHGFQKVSMNFNDIAYRRLRGLMRTHGMIDPGDAVACALQMANELDRLFETRCKVFIEEKNGQRLPVMPESGDGLEGHVEGACHLLTFELPPDAIKAAEGIFVRHSFNVKAQAVAYALEKASVCSQNTRGGGILMFRKPDGTPLIFPHQDFVCQSAPN